MNYIKDMFSGKSQSNNNSNNINICLVGCVSAGKSTILNAFFGQDYAQCKIKRTTMMPNVFVETKYSSQIDSFEKINRTIADVNAQIYTQTDRGTRALKLEDYGGELKFYVESMEMNVGNNIQICIYDIPGLNDARTKEVYYNYLEKNFYKFNIILFVIDIQSGLNTSDEMDILKFLSSNIAKHKTESNKNIGLLGIINKADDMQLNGNKLEVLGELGEMFEQSTNTIAQEFTSNNIRDKLLGCIPVCGLDSHLYRMIRKYKDINKLTDENILRIGVNEEGSKFRRLSKEEQRKKIQSKINNTGFVDDMIVLTGFAQIEQALNKYIGTNGSSMVIENLLYEYNKLDEMIASNMFSNIKKRVEILSCIIPYSNAKYEEEMKKVIKQINTIFYRSINSMSNPVEIKKFYDLNILSPINSDKTLKNKIEKFFDLTKYPNYFIDRILELVVKEFSEHTVSISKLSYIELFENIGNLKTEVLDVIIDSLLSNPRGTNTFVFDIPSPTFFQTIIRQIDKVKISTKFIDFLRFLMANIYTNLSKPEELVTKLLIFNRFEEIPMKQFINDLRIEKKLIDTNKQITMYSRGLGNNFARENLLELYYIIKCRELGDNDNFLSHDKAITIDFSNII